jgi:hypothetical protein
VVAEETDRFTRACIIIAHNTAAEVLPGLHIDLALLHVHAYIRILITWPGGIVD